MKDSQNMKLTQNQRRKSGSWQGGNLATAREEIWQLPERLLKVEERERERDRERQRQRHTIRETQTQRRQRKEVILILIFLLLCNLEVTGWVQMQACWQNSLGMTASRNQSVCDTKQTKQRQEMDFRVNRPSLEQMTNQLLANCFQEIS